MKKLLVMLSMLLMASAVLAEEGPNRRGSLDGAGSFKGPDEKFFISVKNVSGGALLNGDVVILDVTEDDGYSVNTSATAGAVPHCILSEACADDAMCKCQTYGIKSDVNFDVTNASATAGQQAFISESNAGNIEAEALGTIAASDSPVGVFFDAASASGDVELFIRLR